MTVKTFFQQNCLVCGRPMRVNVQWLGQRIRCRHCHSTMQATDDGLSNGCRDSAKLTATSELAHFAGPIASNSVDFGTEPTAFSPEAELADRSILLVESDKQLLELMSRQLTAAGYAVTPVHHPRMALQAMAVQPHRIAIISRQLPECEGQHLIERLRGYISDLCVIFLFNDTDACRTVPESCSFFLTKPFSMDVLKKTVRLAVQSTYASAGGN